MGEKSALGKQGEEIANAYLAQRRYRILARNWVARSATSGKMTGELDIIAKRGNDVVFIEVKAGVPRDIAFRPEIHVSREKLVRLTRAAKRWLAQQRLLDASWQIDIIAVEIRDSGPAKIRHIPRVLVS